MTRRPLALLAAAAFGLTVALAAPAATAAPTATPCQPESCPPPCPFHGVLADLLCPQPV
jgi:hypothetical protein